MTIATSYPEALPDHAVRDPAGFTILVDAAAADPISLSYFEERLWLVRFKGWLKRLLSLGRWPGHSRVPFLDLIRSLIRSGDRVLDLGAHIGTVSLAAAALGCEVIAVEPDPRNAALLRASAARNGFRRLRVIEAAASDRAGNVEFSPRGPFGHIATPATYLPSISVPALRVDDLLAELGWDTLAFIKMDIEGSEIAALRGMSGLLSRPDAPPILYECNAYTLGFYDATPTQLKAAFEQYGYQSYRADSQARVLARPDDIQPEVVTDYLALKAAQRYAASS